MTDHDLDTALARWATAPIDDSAAVARLLAHADALPMAPPRRRTAPWWMLGAGGALAASLALGLLLAPAPAPTGPAAANPADSFAMLYTPTPEEEYLL